MGMSLQELAEELGGDPEVTWFQEHLRGECGGYGECGYCEDEYEIRHDGIEEVTLYEVYARELEFELCPKHGRQKCVGFGVTGPEHDPYSTHKLGCGCEIGALGPEPGDVFFVREAK